MSAAGFTVSRLDPNDGEWRKDGVNMVAIGQWTPIKRASMRHFNSLETSAEALPACAPDTRRRLLRTEPGMDSKNAIRLAQARDLAESQTHRRCAGMVSEALRNERARGYVQKDGTLSREGLPGDLGESRVVRVWRYMALQEFGRVERAAWRGNGVAPSVRLVSACTGDLVHGIPSPIITNPSSPSIQIVDGTKTAGGGESGGRMRSDTAPNVRNGECGDMNEVRNEVDYASIGYHVGGWGNELKSAEVGRDFSTSGIAESGQQ
ncbi:hypothetical protein C8J57DRAFT_1256297 [Mycena rebaudengoi]|nr:hypothetical protein C8J57DRAFT_1256297 [Mycena rebaudengoi]